MISCIFDSIYVVDYFSVIFSIVVSDVITLCSTSRPVNGFSFSEFSDEFFIPIAISFNCSTDILFFKAVEIAPTILVRIALCVSDPWIHAIVAPISYFANILISSAKPNY